MSFNIGYPATDGPFVGESAAAKGLRMAFALAVVPAAWYGVSQDLAAFAGLAFLIIALDVFVIWALCTYTRDRSEVAAR